MNSDVSIFVLVLSQVAAYTRSCFIKGFTQTILAPTGFVCDNDRIYYATAALPQYTQHNSISVVNQILNT